MALKYVLTCGASGYFDDVTVHVIVQKLMPKTACFLWQFFNASSKISIVGLRAPLSSKRPLLSVEVSVCLSVRCPLLFTHFRLTDLDETWQLGPTLAQTRCFEVSSTCAP